MTTSHRSRPRNWDREFYRYPHWSHSPSPEYQDYEQKLTEYRYDRSLSSALSDISSSSSLYETISQPEYKEKSKKRKKEKRKKSERRKKSKREKKRHHNDEIVERINPEESTSRSKAIFASGNNILVSVSFGENESDGKPRKRNKRRKVRLRDQDFREETPEDPEVAALKRRKNDSKPVAVIDLDGSPKQISSPRVVIEVSDEEDKVKSKKMNGGEEENEANGEDEEGEEEEEEEDNGVDDDDDVASDCNKIGPNTPPEPAPKSPENYDPKSRSQSPSSDHNVDSILSLSGQLHSGDSEMKTDLNVSSQTSVDLTSSEKFNDYDDLLDLHPTSPFEKIDQLSPKVQSSPTKPLAIKTPIKTAGHKKYSSISTKVSMPQPISTLPVAPKQRLNTTTTIIIDDDLDDGTISPYSPNSSDYDDLFDPPQSEASELTVANLKKVFGNETETLYGSLKNTNVKKLASRKRSRATKTAKASTKMSLEEFDDIPNSAVDLQVKDKYLKKFHRQERVVEEVKLFLKPHFNKKHLTKDEYKEILRRAVPKICHSRSGEINPAKIQLLCEAYVKKFVAKRKSAPKPNNGNAIVSSTTLTA